MSSVRIALQPPPNVDFVVGYPGIPPGARDRPQAAVKGAVEVRVGPAGAKAKWVRVELKKIETLPGGGQANSYYDHVGPTPISLWQSSEDYSVLQSQDLPFLIRIPESIPPSIALDRGAGIRYELVATVCTLGKKGFFRRRKTAVISQATTIIIDKHELHSTWPVYSQPESRSVHQEGVHLTVERGRTCYGPGDRVSIMAILKSDAVHPVVLRGFEFTLKETTIFRAGPHASPKRSGPQAKVANIGEQKVPLNVTLYNGTQHKAELGCLIPNTHTTTTLNAARHIDITYVIIVRAWIGSMQSVTMELPLIVSNWPRNVSEEAIRRIGHAPSLCVTSPSSPAATVPINTSITRPLTADSYFQDSPNRLSGVNEFGVNSRPPPAPPKQSVQYSTAPTGQNGSANALLDANGLGALGGGSGARVAGTIDHPGYGSSKRPSSRGGLGGIQEDAVLGSVEGGQSVAEVRTTSERRRRPSANANRLTITNISEKDAEDGITPQELSAARPATPSRATQNAWPSAKNEKKILYENAVAKVQKVQGTAAMANATAASDIPSDAASPTTTPKKSGPWPTAEEEKVRMYEYAQATAKRTQAYGVSSPSLHSHSSSDAHSPVPREKPSSPSVTPGPAISAGVVLYQQAVSSISNGNNNPGPNSRASPPSPPSSLTRVPHYPSAEEEKAALRRYHEAKRAVDRNQTQFTSREGISIDSDRHAGPVPYESLYPERDGPSRAGGSDMPPPFESSGSTSQPQYLNEKERLRKQYEAQDNAALAAQAPAQEPPPHPSDVPSYAGPPPEESGLSEKEVLRRRLEEQERMALLHHQQQPQLQQQRQHQLHQEQERPTPSQTSPRANTSRAPPVPPTVNGFKPLTAAEEKALLRAKYAAEEQAAANGHAPDAPPSLHPYASATPLRDATPPPLMPRPPAEYIQETQEADLRGQFYDSLGVGLANALDSFAPVSPRVTSPVSQPRLDMRPFSPFDSAMGYDTRLAIESPTPVRGPIRSPSLQSPAAQY